MQNFIIFRLKNKFESDKNCHLQVNLSTDIFFAQLSTGPKDKRPPPPFPASLVFFVLNTQLNMLWNHIIYYSGGTTARMINTRSFKKH